MNETHKLAFKLVRIISITTSFDQVPATSPYVPIAETDSDHDEASYIFYSAIASNEGLVLAMLLSVPHAATGGAGSVKTINVASFADLMNARMRTVEDFGARMVPAHTRIIDNAHARFAAMHTRFGPTVKKRLNDTIPMRPIVLHIDVI